MNWTKELPTEEGFYWIWCKDTYERTPSIIEITSANGVLGTLVAGYDGAEFESIADYVTVFDHYWMGPLQIPEKPENV